VANDVRDEVRSGVGIELGDELVEDTAALPARGDVLAGSFGDAFVLWGLYYAI
jgi:hypothetical protein